MQNDTTVQKDSQAWVLYVWVAFLVSSSLMLFGIYFMPVDLWVKGYMVMGFFFSVGSTFTLAKTIRDNHESRRIINRIADAKTEKILHEYELKKAV